MLGPGGQGEAAHVLYGACGQSWEPLVASWGPRRASNPLEQSRFTRTETVRFTTVHGNEPHVSVCHLEALDYLRGGFPYLRLDGKGAAAPPEAAAGRFGRSRGASGVPAQPFLYGSFPVDCPREIAGQRWSREWLKTCQIAGFDELSMRVPQPPWGVELTAVGGSRRAPPGANRVQCMQTYV